MMKLYRPSWHEYFMEVAHVVKKRSNCIRMQVGALIVKDNRIVATGYNGTPSGIKNCVDGGCSRCSARQSGLLKEGAKKDRCICIHGEQNAIIQSAYLGVSSVGGTMYVTVMPCNNCAKMIINAGIVRLVYQDNHTDEDGINLLKEARVAVEKYRKTYLKR